VEEIGGVVWQAVLARGFNGRLIRSKYVAGLGEGSFAARSVGVLVLDVAVLEDVGANSVIGARLDVLD
jgi:hypothetical protein